MGGSPAADVPAAIGAMTIVFMIRGAIIAVGIAAMVFWIVALVDCVRRDFPGSNDKIVWVLVIVFTHLLGAIIYWFAGRPRGTLPTATV